MATNASISTYNSADTENRQAAISDWYFRFAGSVLDGVDANSRSLTPLNNASVNFGIGADGSIYVAGQSGDPSAANDSGNFKITPLMLLVAAVVVFAVIKQKGKL